MKLRIFAATALLSATAALAAPPEEQAAAEAATAPTASTSVDAEPEPQDEKKVCRTEKSTGSLTRRTRVCLTAAQWREVNDRTRRGVDEMNSSASGGKICVPNPADPFQGCS